MEGASEADAEVELINLYDRSLNYKGCMSCFACKIKGGKKGICSFRDDLQLILQKAVDADVLFWVLLSMCIIRLPAFVPSWSD